jgi:hypothetical protein
VSKKEKILNKEGFTRARVIGVRIAGRLGRVVVSGFSGMLIVIKFDSPVQAMSSVEYTLKLRCATDLLDRPPSTAL